MKIPLDVSMINEKRLVGICFFNDCRLFCVLIKRSKEYRKYKTYKADRKYKTIPFDFVTIINTAKWLFTANLKQLGIPTETANLQRERCCSG